MFTFIAKVVKLLNVDGENMAKVKKDVKKKKGLKLTHYVLVVIAILLIVLGVTVYRFVFPSYTQDDLYGRRDDNLYEIQEYDFKVIGDFLKTPEFVEDVSFDVRGAVIYALVNVSNVTLEDLMAAYPDSLAEIEINATLLSSYDINVTFINGSEVVEEGQRASFPTIFYHNMTDDKIVWQTKNAWEYEPAEETDQ